MAISGHCEGGYERDGERLCTADGKGEREHLLCDASTYVTLDLE